MSLKLENALVQELSVGRICPVNSGCKHMSIYKNKSKFQLKGSHIIVVSRFLLKTVFCASICFLLFFSSFCFCFLGFPVFLDWTVPKRSVGQFS